MDEDEIVYNAFYLLLTNEFRKKYELAISKCWTICVPCGNSLRNIAITEGFTDDHILKPQPNLPLHYISINEKEPCVYYLENKKLKLLNSEGFTVDVLSTEHGYNRECQSYNILIINKPLLSKYRFSEEQSEDKVQLNRSITCYKEALQFLKDVMDGKSNSLSKLQIELKQLNVNKFTSAEDLSNVLKGLCRDNWRNTMRGHSLSLQRDARFQQLLSKAFEIFIMHHMHKSIYSLMIESLYEEDAFINEKIDQLIEMNITPDQLGVEESLAIDLPSAIVEMAHLDCVCGPWEKLRCLHNSIDLVIAELKGAYADMKTVNDNGINVVDTRKTADIFSTHNFILLLVYVIVRSRPKRLITDLHYIKNFLWSVSPGDGMLYTLTIFETAVSLLHQINIDLLSQRSTKVKKELQMGDLLEVINKKECDTLLDRKMHCVGMMLKESIQSATDER